MKNLTQKDIEQLKAELTIQPPEEVLPRLLGSGTVAGGLWRFFSPAHLTWWNAPEQWRTHWPDLSPKLFFFGEDLWGNQLALKPECENVWLWNHENGELVDLMLDPVTLLTSVISSGLEWIDFYSPQMLMVAHSRHLDVPDTCHLHWTQPLIMGGQVTASNTSVVEHLIHLKGHGVLWAQLHGLSPGSEIVIKPKP